MPQEDRMFVRLSGSLLIGAVAVFLLSSTGCSEKKTGVQAKGKTQAKEDKKDDSKHDAWWCAEHGVPEDICSICMSEAAAKKMFKDQGDWCEIHDRAKSQCFKCDPSKYKKFEDMYVAKYNKKPEPPDKSEFEK